MAETLDKKSFTEKVINGKGLALIDFFAEWCGPCQQQKPILDTLAKEMKDNALIAKVNIEEENELASQYQISAIPTLIFFKDGKIVNRVSGLHDKTHLEKLIKNIG